MKKLLITIIGSVVFSFGCATTPDVVHPPDVIITECPKIAPRPQPEHLFINWHIYKIDNVKIWGLTEDQVKKLLDDKELQQIYWDGLLEQLQALDMLKEN